MPLKIGTVSTVSTVSTVNTVNTVRGNTVKCEYCEYSVCEGDYSRGSHVRGQLKDVLWKTLEEKF